MVYFVRSVATGLIKIGYSAHVHVRLVYLFLDNGPVDLLAVVPGAVVAEHAYHAMFEDFRADGEWFTPDEELMSYIDGLDSCESPRSLTWGCLPADPIPVEPPEFTPLPSWLTATGGAAARGLPLRPPSRRGA